MKIIFMGTPEFSVPVLQALAAQHDILAVYTQLPALTPQPQPDQGVTYATKIDKAEARVDFTQSAETVDRLIRGLSPFPGAWVPVGEERVKLLRSRVAAGTGTPGQLLHGFTLACGVGAVEILTAQREGKRPMPAAEVLKGLTLPPHLA